MDHGDMDHGHGDMDMGDQCNMNVRFLLCVFPLGCSDYGL